MQDTIELNQYFKQQFEKLIDANCVAYVNVIEVRMQELKLLYQVRDNLSMLIMGRTNILYQNWNKFEKKTLSLNWFIDQYNLFCSYTSRTETFGYKAEAEKLTDYCLK